MLGGDDYAIEYYDWLNCLEAKHFWFRARDRVAVRTFRHYLKIRLSMGNTANRVIAHVFGSGFPERSDH